MSEETIKYISMELDENQNLVEKKITLLKVSNIRKCPHYIMLPEHYREDGTCKCNDPKELVMHDWGYRWSNKKGLWI